MSIIENHENGATQLQHFYVDQMRKMWFVAIRTNAMDNMSINAHQ